MLEAAGYGCALLMGMVLGLIGSGGSILTVPILVYLFGIDAVTATGLSLFVVGITAAVGAASHHRLGNIEWPAVLAFGISSILSVLITRRWIMPALPDPILHAGGLVVSKETAILVLFAVLMLVVAWSMIGRPPDIVIRRRADGSFNYPPLLLAGVVVGLLTGLLGAGGGFMIIPALVLLAGLPVRKAVGSSLVIIACNAMIGFVGDPHAHLADHGRLLLVVTLLAIAGIHIGSRLSQRVSNAHLRPAFGVVVLAMGISILVRSLI